MQLHMGYLSIFKRGLKHPEKIPGYILNEVLLKSPDTHWREGDRVKFREGGYVTHAINRPEFAASLYIEVKLLQEALNGRSFDVSLEVGCGYGRLSPWIAEFSDSHTGIDFDREALNEARRLHPSITFEQGDATNLDYCDGAFDLGLTWTVLHHIPDEIIADAVVELKRVVDSSGTIVITELVAGEENSKTWVRPREEYEQLFDPYVLENVIPRSFDYRGETGYESEVMVFKQT